jgi:hypothetical protein
MPLSIAVRPGAKPREFLIDEAAGERLMRDVVVALAGIRAAKAAVLAMTAPAGPMEYCLERHESGEYCELDYGHPGTCAYTSADGEEVTWRAPVACPAVSPDGDACTEAGAHQFHCGPDDDGMRRMWTDADALAASIASGQPLTVAGDEPPCGLRLWGDTSLCELPAGHDPLPSCKGTPRPFARTTAAPSAPSAAEVADAFNAQYGVPAPFPPATDPAEAADPGYPEDAAGLPRRDAPVSRIGFVSASAPVLLGAQVDLSRPVTVPAGWDADGHGTAS